jgi:putative ABC transport system permease protein
VRSAATVFPLPFGGAWDFKVLLDGGVRDEAAAPPATVYTVSTDYFRTMDVPLVSGRSFVDTDNNNAPLVVVISEALARRLVPTGNAIGRRLRVRVPYLSSFDDKDDRPWRTIVGIVGNTRKDFAALEAPNETDVYVPYAQNPRSRQSFVLRTDRTDSRTTDAIRRAVASVNPALALGSISTMSDVVSSRSAERRTITTLLSAFAAFTLVLTALALFASLSFTVVQRRSELAVRIAIGASARSIVQLVAAECLVTTAVGVAGGVVASLALGRVLEHQVYGVATSDPATLVTISLVLVFAAMAACLAPSLRAVHTDPALALRN